MNADKQRFLNLATTPGRLNAEEAGWVLGFSLCDIRILFGSGLLKPLGHPRSNGPKFVGADVLNQSVDLVPIRRVSFRGFGAVKREFLRWRISDRSAVHRELKDMFDDANVLVE